MIPADVKPADARRIARMLKQIDKLVSLMSMPGCNELVVRWTPSKGIMIAGEFHPAPLSHMLREFADWQSHRLRDVLPREGAAKP